MDLSRRYGLSRHRITGKENGDNQRITFSLVLSSSADASSCRESPRNISQAFDIDHHRKAEYLSRPDIKRDLVYGGVGPEDLGQGICMDYWIHGVIS